ncbi:MAG: aldose 1-epimerase family protein [Daejeonella sp.]
MLVLENEFLKATIRLKGAELSSLFNKATGTEHIWQADPMVWAYHSPNLFPVVGSCINNEILVNSVAFEMSRHGFARTSDFSVIDTTLVHAKLELSHSELTHIHYPFKFKYQVLFDLCDNELRVSFKVINLEDKDIYFSVGAHPAFNVPFNNIDSLEDYYIEFEEAEDLTKHLLSVNGLFTGLTETIATNTKELELTKKLFSDDALVFKDLISRKVSLKSKKHSNSIYIKYPHFNYFGIWGKDDVPFVCLEPWLGCADTEGNPVELKNKEAIQTLQAGHVFEVDYTIGVTTN